MQEDIPHQHHLADTGGARTHLYYMYAMYINVDIALCEPPRPGS